MICSLCNYIGTRGIGSLSTHLLKVHKIIYKDYYDTYLKSQEDGVCRCGCGKDTLWSIKSYNLYFNLSHARSHQNKLNPNVTNGMKIYQKNNPNHNSIAGKLGGNMTHNLYPNFGCDFGKAYGKLGGKNCHIKNPGIARENGKKSFTKLNIFKREHLGLTPIEWGFLKNSFIYELYKDGKLLAQDFRFNHGRNGGPILDFSIPNFKLCIELDDPTRHDKEIDNIRDKQLLEIYGWRTIRFTNEEVTNNIELVVSKIKEELKNE